MRKMKDSGIEWIGQIPEEWNIYPTKRFFRHTKTLAGEQVDLYERLALTMNGVIKRSKDDSEGLQPERFDTYQVLRENELVFKLIDLANVKTSRVGLSPYTGIVSPAYIVLSNQNKDNRFFYYFFMSMYYNEIFNNLGDNGVRSSLNAQDLLNLPMVSVPVETQSRIADYLDEKCGEIDRYIEKQQQIIEKLKAYKQAVITEAVTKGLDPTAPMKDSSIQWIGMIPAHWKQFKVKQCATTCSGGTPNSNDTSLYDGGINWVCSFDLMEKEIFSTIKTLTKKGAELIAGELQQPNSILIAMYGGAGTIGNSGLLKCEARTNQAICSIHFNENIFSPEYAFYHTIFLRKYWMYYAVGTRKDPNISQEVIKQMVYACPPIDEQKKIALYLEKKSAEIDETIRKTQMTIDKLSEYKKSLIYEAVTGKLEV